MRWTVPLVLILSARAASGQTAPDSAQVARLAGLGRLWNAIKYFHPWLARPGVNWDSAAVAAVPGVLAATDKAGYVARVSEMIGALGDPATRVLAADSARPAPNAGAPAVTWTVLPDSTLLVTMADPAALDDFAAAIPLMSRLAPIIPTARRLVFDLRAPAGGARGSPGVLGYEMAASGLNAALVAKPIRGPGQRGRLHAGMPPRFGGTSGGYAGAFYTLDGDRFDGAAKRPDQRVAFVLNERSALPPVALAMQAAGTAVLVAEGRPSDAAIVRTDNVTLADGVVVQLRLTDVIQPDGTTGIAPDTVIAQGVDPIAAAMHLLEAGTSRGASAGRSAAVGDPPLDDTYEAMRYPTLPYRLLAAFRVWGVFEYFFPYRDLMGEDWDQVLNRSIGRLAAARDSTEYVLAVAEMVARVHDSHAFMYSPVLQSYFGMGGTRVRLRLIEGQPVVTDVFPDSAGIKPAIEIGAVITSVDGEPAGKRIARIGRYYSASTPQALAYRVADAFLNGPEGSTAVVGIRGGREVRLPRARHVFQSPLPPWRHDRPIVALLPGNVGYADLDRMPVGMVDSMFRLFANTKAIIFDMRGYPQGTAWAISPRLAPRDGLTGACFWRPMPQGPNRLERNVTYFAQEIPPNNGPRYGGRTVMLIDERAISQAEHTGLMFEAAAGTVFVGSPTQGANGDVTNFVVPGRLTVGLSGQGVRGADGRQLQRRGIQPDIPVRPTIAEIRSGTDAVLDRALVLARTGTLPAKRLTGDHSSCTPSAGSPP